MKKTFVVTHSKIKPPRQFEAFTHEINKYIKRERGKALPEGADCWGFDCRFGVDEASSDVIQLSEISQSISWAQSEGLESFYLEILAKPWQRIKMPEADVDVEADTE